jgi:hypothetical protein
MDGFSVAKFALRPATDLKQEVDDRAGRLDPLAAYSGSKVQGPDPSVLGSLANVGLSGLAMAGNLLDVPGSMVRDVATWVPGGIAAQNPFDQLLSPVSSKNRVTGSEIADSVTGGAIDKDSWLGLGTGIALEIGMDPLTYLSLGGSAVGKGGAALRKAGLDKNLVRTANKIAGKELGDQAGRRLGKTSARQTLTPRQAIDDIVSEESLSVARMNAVNEAKRPLEKSVLKRAGKGGWSQDAVDSAMKRVDSNPDVLRAGERAQRETYEAGVQEGYDKFFRAGGTEAMLDEKIGGVAKFSIPFISKKFGDKYPMLRERLLGATSLGPKELASTPWFARPVGDVADATKVAPGGSRGDDLPPGGSAGPGGSPADPSGSPGPTVTPTVSPQDVRPAVSAKDFESISPQHKLFSDELAKLEGSGILDRSSSGLMREIFADSTLDNFQRTYFRPVKEIVASPEALPGASTVEGIPGRFVPGSINKIELSQDALIGSDGGQVYAVDTLLHELGHSMLSRSADKQAAAGVDILGEFKKFVDDGTLEQYFKESQPENAAYYLGNPEEAFAQIFSDSILNRKPTPQGMQAFIESVKKIAQDILAKILQRPGLDSDVSKKANAMVDLVGGFMDADTYKAMFSGDADVAEVASAVVKGTKGSIEDVVKARRAAKKVASKSKPPATPMDIEKLQLGETTDAILKRTELVPAKYAGIRSTQEILERVQDADGILDEVSGITFANAAEADAAADLATARIKQLQIESGDRSGMIFADYDGNQKTGYRLMFVDGREVVSGAASEAAKPTRKVQAREAAASEDLSRLDEMADGQVFDSERQAFEAADALNQMVPENIRSTGVGYAARELDDGSFVIQKTDAPDDGIEFFARDEPNLEEDVASLLEQRRSGFTDTEMDRLDSLEPAIAREADRLSPLPEVADVGPRTLSQAIEDTARRSGTADALEDDNWLARMAGVTKPRTARDAGGASPPSLQADDASSIGKEVGDEGEKFQAPRTAEAAGAAADELEDAAVQWREKGVESPYFKRWFGGSKVVDETGKPQVVYHGTRKSFSEFSREKIGSETDDGWLGKGFYFTSDPSVAEAYGSAVMPVYLRSKKIYDMNGKNFNEVLKEHGGPEGFSSWLRENEYDGAKMWSQYMVLDPTQIKSATGNRGTFDAANPDIRFQAPRVANASADAAGATADEMTDAAKQWAEKGTDSPYFQKWFQGSRVVDEAGVPQVVYHGTKADFSEFAKRGERDAGYFGEGYYFTNSPDSAEMYSGAFDAVPTGANIKPAYVSLKNPLIATRGEVNGLYPGMSGKELSEAIKADGYDGVIGSSSGSSLSEIVAFEPTQIKSATGNTGAFDGANPDIRFQAPKGGSFGDRAFDAAKSAASGTREAFTDAKGFAKDSGKKMLDTGADLYRQAMGVVGNDKAAAVGVAMDTLGGFVKNSAPVRVLTGMFDPSVMGGTTELSQEVGREHSKALEEATYGIRKRIFPMRDALNQSEPLDPNKLLAKYGDEAKARSAFTENYNAIRRYLEDASPLLNKGKAYQLPSELASLKPALDDMRSALNEIRTIELDSGLKSDELDDTFIRYFTRQLEKFPGDKGSQGNLGKVFDPGTPYQNQRQDFLTNIPGGTATINEISIDPKISGIAHGFPNKQVPADVMEDIKKKISEQYGGGQVGSKQRDNIFMLEEGRRTEQLDRFAKWVTGLDPRYAENGIPVFKLDPVQDMMVRMEAGLRASAAANFSTSLLARGANPAEAGGMSMAEVADRLAREGMDGNAAVRNIANKMGDKYKSKYQQMQEQAGKDIVRDVLEYSDGAGDEGVLFNSGDSIRARIKSTGESGRIIGVNKDGSYNFEMEARGKVEVPTGKDIELPFGSPVPQTVKKNAPKSYANVDPSDIEGDISPRDVLKQFSVDGNVADSTFAYMRGFTQPESVNVFTDAIRQMTNLTKSSLTVGFPAFHVRNFVSGQYNNYLGKAADPRFKGPKAYWQPVRDADAILRGSDIDGILDIPIIKEKGISNTKDAMQFLREEIFANKLIGSTQGSAGDIIGREVGSFGSQAPQSGKRSMRDILLKPPPAPAGSRKYDWMNPLGAAGVLGNESDTFLPLRWGRQVGEYVEGLNRIAPYLSYLRQGMDSQTAAKKVMELQFDYSKLTPTDRKLRLWFPFYTYTKNIVPLTVKQLIERPGGRLAQTIRAGTASSSSEPMPDHIARTTAIPFGARKIPGQGDRSFVTGLGFGFEDALSFGSILGGDLQGFTREVASRSNPLLKFGLEQMAGESMYFDGPGGGRDLSDLDPTYGRIRSNIADLVTGNKTVGRAEPIFGSELAENILGNMPTSRLGTTLRTLTDSRKLANPIKMGLNLGTGVKVTDVSEASWDAAMQNKAIERMKELGAREFSRRYFPEYLKERMSDGELTEAEALNEFVGWLGERAKDRKAERDASDSGGK